MRQGLRRILSVGVLVVLCWSPGLASAGYETAVEAAKKGDLQLQQAEFLKAVKSYRQAIDDGLRHPDVYRNLSIALYDLRRVDDAIATMEEAVKLNAETDLFHMELGILYLVKDRYEEAQKHLFSALELNPGLSEAYYFLGQLFHDQGKYSLAWIAGRIADRLGYDSKMLLDRLRDRKASEPKKYPWDLSTEKIAIRQLKVASREDADKVLARMRDGELFEYVGDVEYVAPSNTLGGYAGVFSREELRPQFIDELKQRKVYDAPSVVQTEEGFHLVQKILPFDFAAWQKLAGDTMPQLVGKEEAPAAAPIKVVAQQPTTAVMTEPSRPGVTLPAVPLIVPPVVPAVVLPPKAVSSHRDADLPSAADTAKEPIPHPQARSKAEATLAGSSAPSSKQIDGGASGKDEGIALAQPAAKKTTGTAAPQSQRVSASRDAELFRTTVDSGRVRVYVSASTNRTHAIDSVRTLRELGHDDAFALVRKTASGRELFSIVAGEYAERSHAMTAIDTLKAQGYAPFVNAQGTPSQISGKDALPAVAQPMPAVAKGAGQAEVQPAGNPVVATDSAQSANGDPFAAQRTKFFRDSIDSTKSRVYVMASFREDTALLNVRKLQAQGFPAFCYVTKNRQGKTLYNVIAGEYANREEATAVVAQLEEKGFSAFLSRRE